MAKKVSRKLMPVSLSKVRIEGGFWGPKLDVNRKVTIPAEYEQCRKTGRINAFKLDWQPGKPNRPHLFWDSDVAKWIEAAAYSLATAPDKKLEREVDRVIDLIVSAQQPDGYLNVAFTVLEPENRWSNLRDRHELYCAGHLMEAAVAHYEATGKRKMLDALCRYADYIDSVFGPKKGQKRGYPGHEEIELALVKLYRATGVKRYLKLAKFFIDQRGKRPHYYDREARARGEDPGAWHGHEYDYNQSHLPVRRQATAEGHSVRAGYLYAGMADVAAETDDAELLAACERLWHNVTERRMYITGGIGSAHEGERFTFDYDLPNGMAYAETCAAIALVLWAHRMLQITADSRYADVMERALYNGVLSGVSLDGRKFLYVNPLAAHPAAFAYNRKVLERQEWFACACCPPNIARLLASFGQYVYSQARGLACVHLYAAGAARLDIGRQEVALQVTTDYPWSETVRIRVLPETESMFTLALRIPAWCREPALTVNGAAQKLKPLLTKGYALVRRRWRKSDRVELTLPMPVERVEAHPSVRMDAGRVALQRGPVVYCLEEADNAPDLNSIALPYDAKLVARRAPKLLGGVVVLKGRGVRRDPRGWNGRLYSSDGSKRKIIPITAVPYHAWCNRQPGEMLVWVRQ